jgi:hypothetical protein
MTTKKGQHFTQFARQGTPGGSGDPVLDRDSVPILADKFGRPIMVLDGITLSGGELTVSTEISRLKLGNSMFGGAGSSSVLIGYQQLVVIAQQPIVERVTSMWGYSISSTPGYLTLWLTQTVPDLSDLNRKIILTHPIGANGVFALDINFDCAYEYEGFPWQFAILALSNAAFPPYTLTTPPSLWVNWNYIPRE